MVDAPGRLWFALLVLSVSGCRSFPEGSFRRCPEVSEPVSVGCRRSSAGDGWTCEQCSQGLDCTFTVEARYDDETCCATTVRSSISCHCERGHYWCDGRSNALEYTAEPVWCAMPCDAGVDASIPDAWVREVGEDASGDAPAGAPAEDAGMEAGDAAVCDGGSC